MKTLNEKVSESDQKQELLKIECIDVDNDLQYETNLLLNSQYMLQKALQ